MFWLFFNRIESLHGKHSVPKKSSNIAPLHAAAIGFAMVFSVPRRTLPGIVILAVLAHLLRTVLLEQGARVRLVESRRERTAS